MNRELHKACKEVRSNIVLKKGWEFSNQDSWVYNIFGFKAKYNYQFGYCASFAVALHEVYGLQIWMLNWSHHLFCTLPDGRIVDSLGISRKKLVPGDKDWAKAFPPHTWKPSYGDLYLHKMTLEKVRKELVWSPGECVINEAKKIITTLPEFTQLAVFKKFAPGLILGANSKRKAA